MESCAGLVVLGEGCDGGFDGACVSIFPGDPAGSGVIPGIGICISCWPGGTCGTPVGIGDAVGEAITMPGVCVSAAGVGDAVGDGITMPGVCLCPAGMGIPVDLLAFTLCADALRLVFRFDFRLGVVLGFGLLTPGLIPDIVWPSCCANTFWVSKNENEIKNDRINALDRNRRWYD